MTYNMLGTFHFLGFDVILPLDIDVKSYASSKEAYSKLFVNFHRLSDLQKFLQETKQVELLNQISHESEFAALICLENIHSPTELEEILAVGPAEEEIPEEELKSIPPVKFSKNSDSVPGLDTALRNQSNGVYKIKISGNEATIVGRPKREFTPEELSEIDNSDTGFSFGGGKHRGRFFHIVK